MPPDLLGVGRTLEEGVDRRASRWRGRRRGWGLTEPLPAAGQDDVVVLSLQAGSGIWDGRHTSSCPQPGGEFPKFRTFLGRGASHRVHYDVTQRSRWAASSRAST